MEVEIKATLQEDLVVVVVMVSGVAKAAEVKEAVILQVVEVTLQPMEDTNTK